MPDIDAALHIFSREEEEKIAQDFAQSVSLPYISLVNFPFTPDVLAVIPKEAVAKNRVVAFYKLNNEVKVATDSPKNPELVPALKELSAALNVKFFLYYCSKSSIDYAIAQLEFLKEKPKDMSKHVVSEEYIKSKLGGAHDLQTIGRRIVETSTTEILDIVFAGAIHLGASDIHIEPAEDGARLRYRIDGILQDIAKLPHETYKAIDNRIKYLSSLKMNVTEEPQDGRFDIEIGKLEIDVRVSIMPSAFGEVIVSRLLNPTGSLISLEELGFNARAMKDIEEAIAKPNGAIFNTGPTGSGKTTTLYAILQKLNKPEVKIITLEDPIEYRIEGIDQSQMNVEAGYDFASGLKHALRQDPDIIMVGEIRDKETAETALQASLTGHLVLTTLHTNSAPSTIPRLIDIGVRPFLLSGSINLIIAQRLVRKLCRVCLGKGVGCGECKGTGYKGRIAIIETLKITPAIERLIVAKAAVSDFERVAREEGMITMYADGMEKVKLGLTSEEEVKRVATE
jgi:type IV pilus assembly protein PilB